MRLELGWEREPVYNKVLVVIAVLSGIAMIAIPFMKGDLF
jgi:hypothetical protein